MSTSDDESDLGDYAQDVGARDVVPVDREAYPLDNDRYWDETYDDDEMDEASARPTEILIIPGGTDPIYSIKRRRRPLAMQWLIIVIVICLSLSALVSISPLDDRAVANGLTLNPFNALANAIVGNLNQGGSHTYRARSGDTFTAIAQAQNVTVAGIYKLNNLYATDEIQIGKEYQIPNDSNYGANFVAPLPPGANIAGDLYPAQNYNPPGNICNFCAVGGVDNGPGGTCTPNWQLLTLGDVVGYHLINPDQPVAPASGTSRWVRGFTGDGYVDPHSGVDISTQQFDTPIYAAQDGQVIFAPSQWESGKGGLTVKINHCGGLATSYSHLARIVVKVGDNVKQGQIIGYQGSTGNSTGPHLHYMVWWHNVPFDALCAYPQGLDGYMSSNHYGGCPPNLIKGSYWNR